MSSAMLRSVSLACALPAAVSGCLHGRSWGLRCPRLSLLLAAWSITDLINLTSAVLSPHWHCVGPACRFSSAVKPGWKESPLTCIACLDVALLVHCLPLNLTLLVHSSSAAGCGADEQPCKHITIPIGTAWPLPAGSAMQSSQAGRSQTCLVRACCTT